MSVTVERLDWRSGPLGDAVRASEHGRLRRFVKDEESEPIALFDPRHHTDAGDWYGEHAGKWLCAATLAQRRTGDLCLQDRIGRIAAFLVRRQEKNGYLGTYTQEASCRFTSARAREVRTWDLWVHSWTILGLLAAGRVEAANRIGELILQTFPTVHPSLLDLGNHAGLSSMIVLQSLAELGKATGDARYFQFALDTIDQARRRGLDFLEAADVTEIGTGKVYQILWILLGMAALHKATGEAYLLAAVERLWQNVAERHLTPLGGPWGGIASHKEVFNPPGFFSPYGLVETCSATTWMVLSRELFLLTGQPKYIDAVERTLMNTILGAMNPNGQDWCYFTFPNGRRNDTYHWACCKSSGALALEEAAPAALTPYRDGLSLNLYDPFLAEIAIDGIRAQLLFEDHTLTLRSPSPVSLPIYLRQPDWGQVAFGSARSSSRFSPPRNGQEQGGEADPIRLHSGPPTADGQLQTADHAKLDFAVPVRVHTAEYSLDHHGQEIVHTDYACVSKGPFVYATGLIDGYKKEETLRLPRLNPDSVFREVGPQTIDLRLPAREPIPFVPYWEQSDWRTTWLQVAWQ